MFFCSPLPLWPPSWFRMRLRPVTVAATRAAVTPAAAVLRAVRLRAAPLLAAAEPAATAAPPPRAAVLLAATAAPPLRAAALLAATPAPVLASRLRPAARPLLPARPAAALLLAATARLPKARLPRPLRLLRKTLRLRRPRRSPLRNRPRPPSSKGFGLFEVSRTRPLTKSAGSFFASRSITALARDFGYRIRRRRICPRGIGSARGASPSNTSLQSNRAC